MIVVGAASAAMVAAVKRAADRVVAAVEKVEEAVYSYSDAVAAAEMRQDKTAGCRSDVARHIVQAVVQYNRAHSALWLQRRLQSAMESAVRAAAMVGAERQFYWRMQVFEAKLQITRDLLVEPTDPCSFAAKFRAAVCRLLSIDDGCRVAGPAEQPVLAAFCHDANEDADRGQDCRDPESDAGSSRRCWKACSNPEVQGNPVDVKMQKACRWSF